MARLLIVVPLFALCAFQDPPPKTDFMEEVKALRAEYVKAEQEWMRPYREAKTEEERQKVKLDPATHPGPAYFAKFQDLAERAKGTEAGAEALFEVFTRGQRVKKKEEARAALDRLIESHLPSPVMERLAMNLRYAEYQLGKEACRFALEAIEEKSPLAGAKAAAIFVRSAGAVQTSPETARAGFIRLQKEFKDTQYAAMADKHLFELDFLQIGKTAPDFEASDEKGVKFKLSDFRGKVTVIDFWGYW
jgi:hypothetical protein